MAHFPQFHDVSEGAMAFLASCSENWRQWKIEECFISFWEWDKELSAWCLMRERFRGRLSITKQNNSSVHYRTSTSPSKLVIDLLQSTQSANELFEFKKDNPSDPDFLKFPEDAKKIQGQWPGQNIVLRAVSLRYRFKNSQAEYKEKNKLLKFNLIKDRRRIFSGGIEDLVKELCI